ncbi:HNH endonuclease [Flavobacterium sp.]|uniref:HNH endonuclease n=1 Tax=Flavobacterium sp. TaxID=239 RepID=UPI00375375EB
MDKAVLIKNICGLLLDDKRQDCVDFANENYPFINNLSQKRQYTKHQMCKVFLRDGFIDRYSGDKLIFPGLIKILTLEFSDVFKYHRNWKMSETHMIYWDLFPTIDHLIPVARGGEDNDSNWITTSMIRNSAKSNWTIEEIGWKLQDKGQLDTWDGLVSYFINLTDKNPDYEKDNYIKGWKVALLKAMKETKK